MATNNTTYTVEHGELIEALIRHLGIKEGLWTLQLRFNLAAGNAGPDIDNVQPTAFVSVAGFGLKQVDTVEVPALTRDASVVSATPPKLAQQTAKPATLIDLPSPEPQPDKAIPRRRRQKTPIA